MLENYSLKKYNSFGIDVKARFFDSFSTEQELAALIRKKDPELPTLILGGGSNILFRKDYDGWVLKNEMRGIEAVQEDDDHVYLNVAAGENWHQLVMYSVNNNLGGLENLSLIPGNTGAGPMQNIGAYGVEMKDVFHELTAWHLKDKVMVKFDNNACGFGYRESVFKNRYKGEFVIMSVCFRLSKKPVFNTSYGAIEEELERMNVQELNLRAISQAVINIRRSKLPDPSVTGNAGSFFKNPVISLAHYEVLQKKYPSIVGYPLPGETVKLAAGWLIEQCGWKGYRKGDAGCHNQQALVLVNYGLATGEDIYELSEQIISSVADRFSVSLEREVNIL